jgi:ankyrin repeat protein
LDLGIDIFSIIGYGKFMRLKYATIWMLTVISLAGFVWTETADSSDQTLYQAQSKLKHLGYNPGVPDGMWGKKTRRAVKRFQRDHGLPVTGKLDHPTQARLSLLKPVSQVSFAEAVKENVIDKVKELLAAGVDLNARDKLGETPLHLAAVRGYRETSLLLISNGAQVNAKDKRGLTPLHAAAWGGHEETVKLLLSKGADINARDENGVTVLHTAALAGRTDTAALLIANGASINAKNDNGLTPLHAAALAGQKETVVLLIAEGADIDAKNEDGLTPLDAASQRNHLSIAELLRKYKTQ